MSNKKPTNWWGRQNAAPLEFDSKQSEVAFSTVFFRDNLQPEVAHHVIFGVVTEETGVDGLVKFGDARSNHSLSTGSS